MTYIFASKNTSVVITLSADDEEEAWNDLNSLINIGLNDFRLSHTEKD
jgi:phosphotransferase system HPr-like phosphotransfer protein